MARRRKEDLVEVLMHLPWQAGIIVGLLGFAFFRWGLAWYFNSVENPYTKALGAGIANGALEPVAWLFLGIGILGAVLSVWRAKDRAKLLDEQTGLDSLRAMSWQQFERLVGEAYRRLGYSIEETGQGGADGGIDLLLRKDGVTTLVQCKQWRTQKIGVAVVREMYGLMVHHRAGAIKIVCTGIFTSECEAFAIGKPLELVDGNALLKLVDQVKVLPNASVQPLEPNPTLAPVLAVELPPATPNCPKCGASMIERSNRATGQRFWGCTSYPKCRGTIAI
jgi:restriction system protein